MKTLRQDKFILLNDVFAIWNLRNLLRERRPSEKNFGQFVDSIKAEGWVIL
jgi:hypothetical protein